MTVPANYTGNVLVSAYAYEVPQQISGGTLGNVIWRGSFYSTTSGLRISAKWAAAVYNTLGQAGLFDDSECRVDCTDRSVDERRHAAGTVGGVSIKQQVISGAKGSGGSNYTGSYSSTASIRTLIADGAAATGIDDTLGRNNTGVWYVSVDGLVGDIGIAQQARIDAAIATLNVQLGPLGTTIVQVLGSAAAEANIQIHIADTSLIGGREAGVLGVAVFNEITVISNWDYYLGTDPLAIGAGQFDFESVVMHELGHALGLGHSTGDPSVMFPFLAPGVTKRALTADDLARIGEAHVGDDEAEGVPEALVAVTPSAEAGQVGIHTAGDRPLDALLASGLLLANSREHSLSALDAAFATWLDPGNKCPQIAAPVRTGSIHNSDDTRSLKPSTGSVLDGREVDEIWHEVGADADCSWLAEDPNEPKAHLRGKAPQGKAASGPGRIPQ